MVAFFYGAFQHYFRAQLSVLSSSHHDHLHIQLWSRGLFDGRTTKAKGLPPSAVILHWGKTCRTGLPTHESSRYPNHCLNLAKFSQIMPLNLVSNLAKFRVQNEPFFINVYMDIIGKHVVIIHYQPLKWVKLTSLAPFKKLHRLPMIKKSILHAPLKTGYSRGKLNFLSQTWI